MTPAAEFNIYDDPDAAQIVFKSGVPLVMCGLDVTMQAELAPQTGTKWPDTAIAAAAWYASCLPARGARCRPLGSRASRSMIPALSCIWHTRSCSREKWRGVFVETQAELTLGKTVTDLQSDKKFEQKNALVLLKLDREAFMQLLKDCIRTLP